MGRLKDEAIYREDNPKGLAEAEAAYERSRSPEAVVVGMSTKDLTISLAPSLEPDALVQTFRITEDQLLHARDCLFNRVAFEAHGDRLIGFRLLSDAECETCSFVEAEYARANDSDLTRDALALQNAALKADLESLRSAISNLRVLRSSCADSHDGDFRVHLCEREFDALTIMAKAGRVQ
jgi:hypothetical protein